MEMNQTNSEEAPMAIDAGEGTPMDEAIGMVESYIADPKLATPETLGMLKSMLEEIKPMIDGDDREGMDEPTEAPSEGISGMIGKMKNKEGE